jgi:peptidyl-dipeptidase A
MRKQIIATVLFFGASSPFVLGQNAADSKPATAAEAQEFVNRADTELLKLQTDASHAEWTAETDITDDTEATTALLNEQVTGRTLALTAESHRFDHLTLPEDVRRQIMLLQVNAPAAPKDTKLLAEQSQLAAQLTGMYGKGKFCPSGPQATDCMGIDAISDKMAKSRDPEELTRLWVGWHAVGAPMREKYARFIELQNTGARELGYHDTGELWRAGYDMTPAEFSSAMERAWTQLEPLYRELHTYVRARLIAKYGRAADRADGLIPAQLLGNMWAQEWGNIYDIVAPTDPKLSQFKPLDLEAALKRQIAEKDAAAAPAFAANIDLSSDAGHAARLAAARDMVHYGENFFTSLGFPALPRSGVSRIGVGLGRG